MDAEKAFQDTWQIAGRELSATRGGALKGRMAVPLDARAMREDMLERAGFDLAYREDVLAEIGDDSPGAFSLGSSMQWLHALEQKE